MYDARGGGRSGTNNNAMFGLAVGGVVIAAFAAVVLWPSSAKGVPGPVTAVSSSTVPIDATFASKEERAFATTLAEVDPDAYHKLERRLKGNALTSSKRHEIMMQSIETVALDNIEALAKSDAKHFDAILDDIGSGLKKASRSNAKLCKGKTYTSMESMNQVQVGRFMERELLSNPAVLEFGLKLNRRLLEAILDGRENPKDYGELDASDQRSMQGLARSLMFQPEIMSVFMAASSGADADAVLAKADLCQLSVAVLKAVDTLPTKTKGRIWSQVMSEVQKKGNFNLDPSSMGGLSAF